MANVHVVVPAGAHQTLTHYQPEGDSGVAYRIEVGEGARCDFFVLLWGGQVTTFSVELVLRGEGSSVFLKGLYSLKDKQKVDVVVVQRHEAVDTRSEVVMKGILFDEAKAVFKGTIAVDRSARGTHAELYNKNLVLSERAAAMSMPRLEVQADAVHCKHGSAVGNLADEQLFYLNLRGLSDILAKNMLIESFAGEVLAVVPEAGIMNQWRKFFLL